MAKLRTLLFALLALLAPTSVLAEVVVVVGAGSGIKSLTQDEVINIFLGRYRKLPSGILARPYDLPAGDELRTVFYRKLVDKNPAEISAYWARLYFSGKAKPPEVSSSVQEMIKAVATVEGAIGYVERRQVDERVRIVLPLGNP
ncbi:MAG: hypothetical protein JSR83_02950 [Proteobacteria bacterium]|nr:hypothetical protein [Pseudomonadota bacterium]